MLNDVPIIERDFFRLMCGEFIGEGADRKVYELAFDRKWVVKIEVGCGSFSNIKEWEAWQDAQFFDEAAKWLAPCHSISPCGIVMIQQRTRPAKKYPDKVPAWLADLKKENFGMIGNRFVCHDYGLHLLANAGMTTRMKKVKW